jgi:hypothetical protein
MTEDLLTNVRQQLEERIEELRDAVEERDRLQANLRALEAEPWVLDAELTRPTGGDDAVPETPDVEPAEPVSVEAEPAAVSPAREAPNTPPAAPVTAEADSAAMISGQQTLDVELGMLAADPGPQDLNARPPAADSESQEAADADPGPPAADPGSLEADPTPPAADPEPQEAVDADPSPPTNVVPLPARPAPEAEAEPESAYEPEPTLEYAPAPASEPSPAPEPEPALESEPTPESAPAPAPEPSLESEPTPAPAPAPVAPAPAVSPKIARLMSAPRRPALERSGIARVGGRADASRRGRVDEDEPPDEIYEQAI